MSDPLIEPESFVAPGHLQREPFPVQNISLNKKKLYYLRPSERHIREGK